MATAKITKEKAYRIAQKKGKVERLKKELAKAVIELKEAQK